MIVLDFIHKINLPTVVALGNFDSMHLGHQELIKKTVEIAKSMEMLSVVFTFDELPVNVIAGKKIVRNVLTKEEKYKEIERFGVDILVNAHFDDEMQGMSPKSFVEDILVSKLNCSVAVCGYNYSFGYMGHGNSQVLASLGEQCGFETEIIEEFTIDNSPVSSTRIRRLLEEGNMEDYAKMTGRWYTVEGKVIEGQHLGNRMGYPTVNLNLSRDMTLPLNGVYVTVIFVDGHNYLGVTNVGNKPTVGDFEKNSETHIFNFKGDLYGKVVKVSFIHFMRAERKFDSIEELESQISKDCENAMEYYRSQARK